MSDDENSPQPRRASSPKDEPIRGFPDNALSCEAIVQNERGRWVVYLEVTFWDTDNKDEPISVVRRRIADYATQKQAEVAASYMKRGADRDLPHPPMGWE